MTDGALIDETEIPAPPSLSHDMACVILRYTRDRPGGGHIGRRLAEKEAQELAADLARMLSPMIGGRYVPKAEHKELERQLRNKKIVEFFKGKHRVSKNFEQCRAMLNYEVSRRLIASVLQAHDRAKTVQRF